jgi:hypothetical protein
MLPLPAPILNGVPCTHDEHKVILQERLATLAAATAQGRLDGPLPVRWRVGWRCRFTVLRRERDGSLRVHLYADGPRGERYERNVRLVRRRPLPYVNG